MLQAQGSSDSSGVAVEFICSVGSGVAVLQAQGGSDSSGVAVEFICNSIAVDEFICLITLNEFI